MIRSRRDLGLLCIARPYDVLAAILPHALTDLWSRFYDRSTISRSNSNRVGLQQAPDHGQAGGYRFVRPRGPDSLPERDASPRDTQRSDAGAHLAQRLGERMARCAGVAQSVSPELGIATSIQIGQYGLLGSQNRCSMRTFAKRALTTCLHSSPVATIADRSTSGTGVGK
jgi:hypothetical protein